MLLIIVDTVGTFFFISFCGECCERWFRGVAGNGGIRFVASLILHDGMISGLGKRACFVQPMNNRRALFMWWRALERLYSNMSVFHALVSRFWKQSSSVDEEIRLGGQILQQFT